MGELLLEKEVDAILLSSRHHNYYFTNFDSSFGYVLLTKDKTYLLVDGRYYLAAKEKENVETILLTKKPLQQINELLTEIKINKLGFEGGMITYNQYQEYSQMLNVELISVDVSTVRYCKKEEEIAKIEKACNIVDNVYSKILEIVKPTMTERQLEKEIINLMIDFGADKPSFDSIVVSGYRGALPHGRPTDKVIGDNVLVTIDFGAKKDGYCSDITRTFAVGDNLDEKLVEIYNVVLEAQKLAIASIKPGVTFGEVDKIARDYIANKGYSEYYNHNLGHCLGLEVHENPRVSPNNDYIIEENMVFTIEPGIYIPELGGVRIEDDVVVTKSGVRVLTKAPKELIHIK